MLKVRTRDYRIEWFRIFLAFEVVLCHCIGQSGYPKPWLSRLTLTCVDGFILISGFFGIKFSIKKFIALYAIGIYCAVVSSGFGITTGLGGIWFALQDYWFLHAYAVLMLVAPAVNALFEGAEKLSWPTCKPLLLKCAPLLFLAFGWNFIAGIGGVSHYAFVLPGMSSHSFFTLLGVYIVGRLMRKTNILVGISSCVIFAVLLVSLGLMSTGCLAMYSSPVCVAASVCLFELFLRHAPTWSFARWIAPSAFSIYLLHESPLTIEKRCVLMHSVVTCVGGGGEYCAYIIVAAVIFILALASDAPRRIIAHYLKKFITW